MGDSTDDSYILIEDSRNLDDGDAKEQQGDIRDESEYASRRTLDQQGIFVETKTEDIETAEPIEGFSQRLLDQGGIEIIPDKESKEEEFYL